MRRRGGSCPGFQALRGEPVVDLALVALVPAFDEDLELLLPSHATGHRR
jgi:hypothetical protein